MSISYNYHEVTCARQTDAIEPIFVEINLLISVNHIVVSNLEFYCNTQKLKEKALQYKNRNISTIKLIQSYTISYNMLLYYLTIIL